MTIIVNDNPLDVTLGSTVADVASRLAIPEGGTAIAVNGRLVRRPDWEQHQLVEGDKIMVIRAAYGG